jgi:adenine-specific DNA-methyltransferase
MDGTSLTPEQEKLNALRQVLPEAFSEGKIDWEKLKATLGEDINFSNERYVLNWAGKSDAFKVLQMPTTKTLIPAKDESVNFDETENIFIEGENLEVLKVLQKSYFGKVKMIYIDPPYNTGNDSFIYPDKFSETKADYEKRVGDKDEEGYMTKDGLFKKNSKENGQYHSNWLNMMMPRLYLAKNLLRQDGVIFVSIDDNEVHNLRLLMNEIFGEENFIANIVWLNKEGGGSSDSKHFRVKREFILCYGKSKDLIEIIGTEISNLDRYKSKDEFVNERGPYYLQKLGMGSIQYSESLDYPIKTPDESVVFPKDNNSGKKACWRWSKKKLEWGFENGFIEIKKDLNSIWTVYTKQYLSCDNEGNRIDRTQRPYSVIEKFSSTQASKYLDKIGFKNYFDYTKPNGLIQYLIERIPTDCEIIMDFFAGSGTTAHAVMDLNKENASTSTAQAGQRKYICVQLPELCNEKSEAFKAGYKTIAEISKARISRAGKKIKEEIKQEITNLELRITKFQSELQTEETITEIQNLQSKISNLKTQDLGFKVLKLEISNFKQWQQIEGKNAEALAEQIKLFVDPVSESATIENMVYELLLKSGKDLNSRIEKKDSFYKINNNQLILLLEKATQEIIDKVIAEKPIKVVALDKLFKGNDQLKTNTVLQMRDAEIEFKTI